ncbi:hypothetical protein CPB84DRAFT_1853854 [Gymnopilus junonius]|uniref:Uncharacterized protein n=1 Tax=Gymnopilus junonius TaxID=109634 RepID=A0A9P5NA22_GYMJU|nr:hypothetical protein CPB84DRAFT_1853854 [Gymnopilus junonius]
MAAGLQSIRAAGLHHDEDEEEEMEEGHRAPSSVGEDHDLNVDLEGIDMDVDVDLDLASGEGDLCNEIAVEHPAEDSISRTQSSTPKTPRLRNCASNVLNNAKVVEKDFTPRTLRLALASKSHVHTRTIYEEPFPHNNKVARIDFAWKTIRESTSASEDPEIPKPTTGR